MSIINWTQYQPATRVNNFRGTYLELPVFSLDTGIVWKGASEVVLQFNYSASKDFVLLARPEKPTGVNFGLCIRYRVGDEVTRYKLWEDDAFILSDDDAPLYDGERIRANFVLEIWSFEELTEVSLDTAIQMTTSIRNNITSLGTRSAESLATGAEFSLLTNTNTSPSTPVTTGLEGWYRPDDYGIIVDGPTATPGPLTNADTGGNMTDLNDTGVGVDIYAGANALNGHAWLRFNGSTAYMDAAYAGGIQSGSKTFVGVMRLYDVAANLSGWIIGDYDGGGPTTDKMFNLTGDIIYALKQDGAGDPTGAPELVDDQWVVFYFVVDRTNNLLKVFIEGVGENEVTSGDVNASSTAMYLGNDPDSVGAFPGKFDLAELLVYNGVLSEANLALNIQYLSHKFFDSLTLPLTFNTGGQWLDNDPL